MSKTQNRITATERVKLTMLFAEIKADVPNKSINELHTLAAGLLAPKPIAKSTVQQTLTDMGLTYKASKAQLNQRHGTLQRDTLRAVCGWIIKFDTTLPENSLIRQFLK